MNILASRTVFDLINIRLFPGHHNDEKRFIILLVLSWNRYFIKLSF